jgi:hypothetical protein
MRSSARPRTVHSAECEWCRGGAVVTVYRRVP